jgi:hypothetical protein
MRNLRTIRTAMAAFKGNIYQKPIQYVPEFSYITPKKIIKLVHAVSLTPHDFCV